MGLGAAGRNTARGAYHSVIRSELGAGAGAGADLVADAAAQQLEQLGYQQGDEEERVVALMQVRCRFQRPL